MFHGHLDYFQNPPLGGRSNTKPADHGTPNAHNRWSILFYHVWRPAWIEIHWNSIWSRARSHMTSHYTWGSVTTIHDFGGILRPAFGHSRWTLTISWSRLLARVWSGPHSLISQNPRERMFSVQISLCYCHIALLHIHGFYHWCKSPKKSTHTLALCHVSALLEPDQCFEGFGNH
jgi:hypothetical protein